ncbi:hypothetical protein GGQ73_004687 [Rhizobium skierniewicense]|uniref:Uncharacterized protein n=1 Tax=Rhizobium skierniewicense TaxID=984260 RepID=A0A7W6G5M1_9HYPH|nr:hypothetical protein [Rhizobium skierniewicense]MBB3948696.1 hypothetical protein [Rhizobium skierniewicense]
MSELIHMIRFGIISFVFGWSGIASSTHAQEAFDPGKAFCERQTFSLETIGEIKPWLDYFSGLRNGRSDAPGDSCQSSTVRSIVEMSRSSSVEVAEARREAILVSYIAKASEPELAEKKYDVDGSFRYRNDLVLAGFTWLLCPGRGTERATCVRNIVLKFPDQFLSSSPILCDFSRSEVKSIEWPEDRRELPLLCRNGGDSQVGPDAWLKAAAITFGD